MTAVVSENAPEQPFPISPSMDSYDSSKHLSGDSPSGSVDPDALDLSSPASIYSSPKGQLTSRSEEYRQLFRLPSDETLIQDYNCALQDNFLLQGHMYLFDHYICFYSNLFGFETKRIIPFQEITSIRRAKAVAVFPTAIEIITSEKKYFFTSFLFRDEAFKLIDEGWQRMSTDQTESKDDISNRENDSSVVGDVTTPRKSLGDLEISRSNKNRLLLEESANSGFGEFEFVPAPVVGEAREEASETREVIIEEAAPFVASSSSSEPSLWSPEDIDAPTVPEGFIMVAETKFQISVEDFYDLFFSNDGIDFLKEFHGKCGDKDFKCTTWRPEKKFGHARDVSFQHPIKIYFGAKFGICKEIQKFRVYRNGYLVVDTSQDISDVPYSDYFKVEGRWDVEDIGNISKPGCIVRVYSHVSFSKKTMWKGKIVQSTIEECREVYGIWIDQAHEVLKQRNLEQEENARSISVQRKKQENASETAADTRPSRGISVSDIPPPQNNIRETPEKTWSEYISATLSSSLKHRNLKLSLVLIIAIALILILMQISIVVLLSRPQRVVIIREEAAASTNGILGSSLRRQANSLRKQMEYLETEMHFAETVLERIRDEHGRMKVSLDKQLELLGDR